jgi:hypothetical protein
MLRSSGKRALLSSQTSSAPTEDHRHTRVYRLHQLISRRRGAATIEYRVQITAFEEEFAQTHGALSVFDRKVFLMTRRRAPALSILMKERRLRLARKGEQLRC